MNYLRVTDFKNKDSEDYCGAYLIESTKKERDFTEDYILPDFLPDAKKILKFTAKPVIETRFIGNSNLEYSGSIYCRALYLAENSTLCCASFTVPFEDKLSDESLTDECVDFLYPRIISPLCRLQNPRKMNVRMKLSSDIEIYARSSTMPELYGARPKDEKNLQTNVKAVPSMNVTCLREDDLSFAQDITLDKSNPDIAEIIYSDAEVFFDECRSSSGDILCRGSVIFECVYRTPDNDYRFLRRSIPISETLVADNIPSECSVFALCCARTPEVNVIPDEFGLKRIIELELSYGVEICCKKEKTLLYVADAFVTTHDAQCTFTDMTLYSPCDRIVSGFSVGESIKGDDCALSKGDSILAYFMKSEIALCENPGKHGKLFFEGTCEISLIVTKADNPPRCTVIEIPLRFESDRPFSPDTSYSSHTVCKASNPRIRFDGENLFVDFELSLSSDILKRSHISSLNTIRLLPDSEKNSCNGSVVTVYYPSASEDEWDIAKKYSVTRESLAVTNSMTSNEIPSVVKIPSKI